MYRSANIPPSAYLTMQLEDGSNQRFELSATNTLGRHPRNTIQIMDRLISKEHAKIVFKNDSYYIQDLDSRNGTFVNEHTVSESILKSGDRVRLGTIPMYFHIGPVASQTEFQIQALSQPFTIITDHQPLDDSRIAKITHGMDLERDFLPERDIREQEVLRKDYEKLRIAHLLNRKIGLELDLDKLMNMILDETFNLVSADRGVIFFLDQDGNPIPRCIKSRDHHSLSPGQITISRTIINTAIKERTAVLTSDAKLDQRFEGSQSVIMQGIRSAMCVPLISRSDGGELIGVMNLDTQSSIGVFTAKDLQIMSVVAAQAAVAIENARLAKKIERETVIRSHLQRFLSPAVMDRLNKDDLNIRMGGELVESTVMFTDIRDFTSISEQYDPSQLVYDLNLYFEMLVDVIFAYEGTLDKFIGDAIMAVWGTPQTHEQDPLHAVQAAVEMQQQLHIFNQQRVHAGLPPLYTGIGINTGVVTAGNMGSPKRLEFTVLGDNVNIASRLCSQAQGGEIIISLSTYKRVAHYFQCTALPLVKVKGKAEPIQIFRVDGYKTHHQAHTEQIAYNG